MTAPKTVSIRKGKLTLTIKTTGAGTLKVALAKGKKVVAHSTTRTLKLPKRTKPGRYTLTVTFGSVTKRLTVKLSR